MDKKKILTAAAAAGLLVVNVVVWRVLNREPPQPPDSRETIRNQLTNDWSDSASVPLEQAADSLRKNAPAAPVADDLRRLQEQGVVSFQTLSDDSRKDLLSAVGGLIEALGADSPSRLLAYMSTRGLAPSGPRVDELAKQIPPSASSPPGAGRTKGQLRAMWDGSRAARWTGLIEGGSWIHVWRPSAVSHLSLTKLGRTESWVWGNEALQRSVFEARPTYESANRSQPTLLADLRVVIEHDETLRRERSPYFFRFWLPQGEQQWRPAFVKHITTNKEDGPAPPLVF